MQVHRTTMDRCILTDCCRFAPSNALSMGDISHAYESSLLEVAVKPLLYINLTQLELRDTTAIPWDGPLPLFAQFPNNNRENQAKVGWGEIFLLVREALRAVCERSSSFYRYFSEEDASYVSNVLTYIQGPNGRGPTEITQVDRPLRILYGDQPSAGASFDICLTQSNFLAWFLNWSDDMVGGPVMLLCPPAFITLRKRLLEWTCEELPDAVTSGMATLSSLMLHEVTHWNILTLRSAPAFDLRVNDYGFGLNGQTIPTDGMPPNGYGPYNAMMLNRNRARGLAEDKQPTRNADSWMYFALESYWSRVCSRQFNDPAAPAAPQPPTDGIVNQDNTPRQPDPLNPQAPAFSPMNPSAPVFSPTPSSST